LITSTSGCETATVLRCRGDLGESAGGVRVFRVGLHRLHCAVGGPHLITHGLSVSSP
jgi:hypothetical protein